MTENEFDTLLASCMAELDRRQAVLEAQYNVSKMNRWSLDHHSGLLDFFDAAGIHRLRFPTTPIGTWASRQETWKWAWANTHIDADWRHKAAPLKALAAQTDFELFQEADTLAADESMAWELTAIAVRHLGAQGCYRAPNHDTYLFLALYPPVALV